VARDAAKPIGDCLETDTLRRPRLVTRVRGTHYLREVDERWVVQLVLLHDRVERALDSVVAELASRHIEDDAVGDRLPVGLRRQEDELGFGIDEAANQ